MDSDEEAENGSLTTGFVPGITSQSTAFTSASQSLPKSSPMLPDYSSLGPERWMAAVKAMQKKKVRVLWLLHNQVKHCTW